LVIRARCSTRSSRVHQDVSGQRSFLSAQLRNLWRADWLRLFDGGKRNATIGQQRAQLAKAEENLAHITEEVELREQTAYNKLERTRQMMKVSEELLAVRRVVGILLIVRPSAENAPVAYCQFPYLVEGTASSAAQTVVSCKVDNGSSNRCGRPRVINSLSGGVAAAIAVTIHSYLRSKGRILS
jgi:Outer membrane efflux protein